MIQATLHNACEQDTLSDCVQSLLPETRFCEWRNRMEHCRIPIQRIRPAALHFMRETGSV